MKIKIDDITYLVSWQHDSNRGSTICYIKDEETYTQAIATAFCSEKDHFSREVGRKVSLTKVLRSEVFNFTREERQLFWEAFRTLTSKPKWTKQV